jgi:CRP-like cAMP-binding protein
MELIGRMMDGSIGYGSESGLEQPPPLNQDDKMELLEAVPLFAECSRRQLRAVARITETFDAPAGTMLTRGGEPGEEFFLIVDGRARVDVSPRKQPRLDAGDFFGEMSLIDGEPRSATVVAETSIRLLVIRRRDFATLLEKVPGLTSRLLVTLCRRLRQTEQALRD